MNLVSTVETDVHLFYYITYYFYHIYSMHLQAKLR